MQEPFICDECGQPGRYSGVGTICTSCEAKYQTGRADADDYHAALAVGGEDLAARMELEAEYGYLG